MALSVGIYIHLQKQCEMDHNTKFNKNLKFGIVDHLGTLWLKRWLKTPKKSICHFRHMWVWKFLCNCVRKRACEFLKLLLISQIRKIRLNLWAKAESFYYINYKWSVITSKASQIFSEMKT